MKKEKKENKVSWVSDFKAFIARGNVIDLAVGVVIGSAFTAIVTALVDCIINPLIGLICGGIDFSSLSIGLFPIGQLISAIINFLIIAFVVFWMVRLINKMMNFRKKKEEEAPPAPPEPTNEEKLLMEIRDLLKERNV